jgi:hypothetical protein
VDIQQLIPVPDTIPVAPLWFEILLLLTFILHIVVMNTMLGSAIIVLVSSFRKNLKSNDLRRDISRKLPVNIAFTINTGVAPLLFVQVLYGHLIYTSSVLMAVSWLSVVALLMVLYYGAYLNSYRVKNRGEVNRLILSVTVLAMLCTGFIIANNMTLMLSPERWSQYFNNPRGTLLNLAEPSLYPRFLHFVAASIAMGGLGMAHLAAWKKKSGGKGPEGGVAAGLHWFAGATVCQLLVGTWFLVSLPARITALFLGGSLSATILLAAGITCGAAAVWFAVKKRLWPCTWSAITTIAVMATVRHLVRVAWISPFFKSADLQVIPQYSSLFLFIFVLLVALALIGYMLKLAFTGRQEV